MMLQFGKYSTRGVGGVVVSGTSGVALVPQPLAAGAHAALNGQADAGAWLHAVVSQNQDLAFLHQIGPQAFLTVNGAASAHFYTPMGIQEHRSLWGHAVNPMEMETLVLRMAGPVGGAWNPLVGQTVEAGELCVGAEPVEAASAWGGAPAPGGWGAPFASQPAEAPAPTGWGEPAAPAPTGWGDPFAPPAPPTPPAPAPAWGEPAAPAPAWGEPAAPAPAWGEPPASAPTGWGDPFAPPAPPAPAPAWGEPAAPAPAWGEPPASVPTGWGDPFAPPAPPAPAPAWGEPAAPAPAWGEPPASAPTGWGDPFAPPAPPAPAPAWGEPPVPPAPAAPAWSEPPAPAAWDAPAWGAPPAPPAPAAHEPQWNSAPPAAPAQPAPALWAPEAPPAPAGPGGMPAAAPWPPAPAGGATGDPIASPASNGQDMGAGQPRDMDATVLRRNTAMDRRPTTAFLIHAGSAPVEITRDVIIGRDPDTKALSGRQEAIALKVPSPATEISRSHCAVLSTSPGVWSLMDLGSVNGTLLRRSDGFMEEVAPNSTVALNDGDVIDVGEGAAVEFRLR